MRVNVPRESFFVLLSGVLVQCQQPHASVESQKKFFGEIVFVIFGTERKAVQESYLLVNLNDMFLQQNQTKKQWKWWRRSARRRGYEESEWVNKNGLIGIINSEGEDPFFSLIIKWFQFLILGQSLQEWCRWPGCHFKSLFMQKKIWDVFIELGLQLKLIFSVYWLLS